MAGGYEVAFLERRLCGADIQTLVFERPTGFAYRPGQWLVLHLTTAAGAVAETFSLCSAPSDENLEITTRIGASPFKQALAVLEPGASVHITGPGGRLSLSDDVRRVAFLIGGVGVTPVRSMLRDAAVRGRGFEDALLLFGNRDESCVPFGSELEAMRGMGVRLVIALEQPSEGWTGEAGFITAEMVRRHLDDDDGRPFMVTGPPVMVSAIELVLDELGVSEDRRIIERFGVTERA
jgi:ferredoxin-NADP reductase